MRFAIPVEISRHRVIRYERAERLFEKPDDLEVVWDRLRANFRAMITRYHEYLNFYGRWDILLKELDLVRRELESKRPKALQTSWVRNWTGAEWIGCSGLERTGVERIGAEGNGVEGNGAEGNGLAVAEWIGAEWMGSDRNGVERSGMERL